MIRTSPTPFSERSIALLRCVGHCGPLYFNQVLRVLPAFAPLLNERKSRERLLYGELARLVKRRLLGRRRPVGGRSAAYFSTARGAALVEASGHGSPDLSSVDRFFSKPAHDEILHGLVVELVLAKAQGESSLLELAWSHSERYEVNLAAGGRNGQYEPDAMLWLTLEDRQELTVFVEVDRGTETLGYWTRKIEKVKGLLLGCGSSGLLLVVAEGARRLRSLLSATHEAFGPPLCERTLWITAAEFEAERVLVDPVFLRWSSSSEQVTRAKLVDVAAQVAS